MYNFMLIKWNRKRTTTLSLFFYLQRTMNNQQDDTKKWKIHESLKITETISKSTKSTANQNIKNKHLFAISSLPALSVSFKDLTINTMSRNNKTRACLFV